jgi:hypothetical protein
MKTIYKYPLEITDEQTVMMPCGSEILSAQMQHGQLHIWALVDKEATSTVGRQVRIFGTGNPVTLDHNWKFVDSVQERIFVWHVFCRE